MGGASICHTRKTCGTPLYRVGGPLVHEPIYLRRFVALTQDVVSWFGVRYDATPVGKSTNLIECYKLSGKLSYMKITKGNIKMKTQMQKEKLILSMKWEELLPMYASIYSSLNETGKLQVQKELKILGAKVDKFNQRGGR